MPTSHSILVIGAGPAGSTAAVALARRGHAVTLVEKSRFPRGKVCGECLSALGVSVLSRLELLDRVLTLAPQRLTRSHIVSADGADCTVSLPEPMLGVSREALDATLIEAAIKSGVTVRQPCRATVANDGSILLDGQRTKAKVVVFANGDAGAWTERPTLTGDFGIKAHFKSVDAPRDCIELVGLKDGIGYAGLSPIEAGRWNAAWSVTGEALKACGGDVDSLFRNAAEAHPVLRRRFRDARRVSDWFACALPRYPVRQPTHPNHVAIGNACAALEPVGGEGMGLAMRSAELAAEEIDAALRSDRAVDSKRLQRSFESLWRRRQLACRAGVKLLGDRHLAPLSLTLLDRVPAIARIGLALVGK